MDSVEDMVADLDTAALAEDTAALAEDTELDLAASVVDMEEDMAEEMVGAGVCDTCGKKLYGKSSRRVCNQCPSYETDESEDTETEVYQSEVHEYEVRESMAQAQLKA